MNAHDVTALARALHRSQHRDMSPAQRTTYLRTMEAVADACQHQQRDFNRHQFYTLVKGETW